MRKIKEKNNVRTRDIHQIHFITRRNDVILPALDQEYKDLMNWQIQDEIVIDVDTADNSTNNTRSADYLNEECRLATS